MKRLGRLLCLYAAMAALLLPRVAAQDAPRCVAIQLAAFKSFLVDKIGADHEFFKLYFTPELLLKSAVNKDDLSEQATFVAERVGRTAEKHSEMRVDCTIGDVT